MTSAVTFSGQSHDGVVRLRAAVEAKRLDAHPIRQPDNRAHRRLGEQALQVDEGHGALRLVARPFQRHCVEQRLILAYVPLRLVRICPSGCNPSTE